MAVGIGALPTDRNQSNFCCRNPEYWNFTKMLKKIPNCLKGWGTIVIGRNWTTAASDWLRVRLLLIAGESAYKLYVYIIC